MLNAFSIVRFFIPQEQAVGICFDGPHIRKAVLRLSGSTISIKKLEIVDEILDKNTAISSCIPSTKTIARAIEIALTKQKDIDAAFSFEAETHLPYALEQCIIDKISLEKTGSSTKLQLFSALKSDLQQHLDALKERSIDPEIICPKPLALCHFVQQLYINPDPKVPAYYIVVHIDRQETTCVLIKDAQPLMARSHPVGLDALEGVTYENDEGVTSINEKELDSLQQYLREVSRILLAFNNEDTSALPILFCGPLVENEILLQLFASALERPIAPNPETAISSTYSWQDLLVYAVPIGCAISVSLDQKGQSVNFRKDEFAYSDKWKRWKKE